jgi:ParB family transcriptional regulator, chromosome partitioning protein
MNQSVKSVTPKPSALAGMINKIKTSSNLEALLESEGRPFVVSLDEIEIVDQARKDFGDLQELGESLLKRQLHPLTLRILEPGSAKPYRLLCGERRLRAARLVGITELRAVAFTLDDFEALRLQHEENAHTKPLTVIEAAEALSVVVRVAGGVREYIAQEHALRLAKDPQAKPLDEKMIYKRMQVAHAQGEGRRAVEEGLTNDIETINRLKIVEKANPAKARELVDTLRDKTEAGERVNVREAVKKVAEEVVPPKPKKSQPEKREPVNAAGSGQIAQPKDTSAEAPGPVVGVYSATILLDRLYQSIALHGAAPKIELEGLDEDQREMIDGHLQMFYSVGLKAKPAEVLRQIAKGLREGSFGTQGEPLFALLAYSAGVEGEAKYSLLDLLGAVKP